MARFEPFEHSRPKLPRFIENFLGLILGNFPGAIIVQHISFAPALIEVVGKRLELRTKKLWEHAERDPMVAGSGRAESRCDENNLRELQYRLVSGGES